MALKGVEPQPGVLAQLHITLADGSILLSDIYAGERYDLRLENPG
jgi:hypothetical protein